MLSLLTPEPTVYENSPGLESAISVRQNRKGSTTVPYAMPVVGKMRFGTSICALLKNFTRKSESQPGFP